MSCNKFSHFRQKPTGIFVVWGGKKDSWPEGTGTSNKATPSRTSSRPQTHRHITHIGHRRMAAPSLACPGFGQRGCKEGVRANLFLLRGGVSSRWNEDSVTSLGVKHGMTARLAEPWRLRPSAGRPIGPRPSPLSSTSAFTATLAATFVPRCQGWGRATHCRSSSTIYERLRVP